MGHGGDGFFKQRDGARADESHVPCPPTLWCPIPSPHCWQLTLTLKKEPFELMLSGEKKEEFREKGGWIESRLFDSKNPGTRRQYDTVKFINGYGSDKPWFTTEFKGFQYSSDVHRRYSTGFEVDLRHRPTYIILLGDIIERGNVNE